MASSIGVLDVLAILYWLGRNNVLETTRFIGFLGYLLPMLMSSKYDLQTYMSIMTSLSGASWHGQIMRITVA
jgi:hypothetical protein